MVKSETRRDAEKIRDRDLTWHAVYEGVVLEKKSKMERPLGRMNVKARPKQQDNEYNCSQEKQKQPSRNQHMFFIR